MRLLTRKIYRAFPELDSYGDEQCVRFVRAARRVLWVRCFHSLVISLVTLVALAPGIAMMAMLADWMSMGRNNPGWSEGLKLGAWILSAVPLLGTGLVLGYLTRDWLLRRRLRYVLRIRGQCPECGYGLVGLAVSADNHVTCPECGIRIQVDASLSELARQGGAVVISDKLIAGKVFWTPRRRKFLKRTAIGLAILLFGVAPATLGVYEWMLRAQAARAKADIQTIEFEYAKKYTEKPSTATSVDAWTVFAIAQRKIDDLDNAEWKAAFQSGSSQVYPEFTYLYATPQNLANDPTDAELRKQQTELARRMLDLYRDAAVFEAVRPMMECDWASGGPTMLDAASPRGPVRNFARMNAARMALAAERGDKKDFLAAVEEMMTLANASYMSPTTIDAMVGVAVETLTLMQLRNWSVKPNADLSWIEEIDAAIIRQRRSPNLARMLEMDERYGRLLIAQKFSDVGFVRWGPFSKAMQDARSGWPSGQNRLGRYSENVAAMERIYGSARKWAAMGREERSGQSWDTDPDGLMMVRQCTMSTQTYRFFDKLEQERDAWKGLSAIYRWKRDHGAYPEKFEEVAGLCGGTLPIDIHSGKPFVYRRVDPATDAYGRGFKLYSVGTDGADDGGTDVDPAKYGPTLDTVFNDPCR